MNIALVSVLLVCTLVPASGVHGQLVELITERGNVFVVDIVPDTGDAEPMIDGIGISSRIVHHDPSGTIIHGQSLLGTEKSITPYVHVPSQTRFVAALEDENDQRYRIISPYAQYAFDGTGLVKTSDSSPNIMGYQAERTISGDIHVSSVDDNHITISGTGRLILSLTDMGASFVNGTASLGTTMRIVQSPYDLMSLPYHSTHGFVVNHIRADPTTHSLGVTVGSVDDSIKSGRFQYVQSAELVVYHGKCCKGKYTQTGQHDITTSPHLLIDAGSGGYYEVTGDRTDPQTMDPQSIMRPGAKLLHIVYNRVGSFDHQIYDTLPVRQVGPVMEGDFNSRFDGLSGAYLVVDSSGGTSEIGAVGVTDRDFLRITGLEAGTVYRIASGDNSIVAGITDGQILIDSFEVPVEQTTLWMHLYDNSMLYKSSDQLQMLVMDHLNVQTIRIASPENLVYNIHAYVKIPVIGNVTIRQLVIDDLSIPYLNGNYRGGQSILVPIIPGYKTISMSINGESVSINIADVLGSTGLRISDPKSSTVSIYRDTSIHHIESTVGIVTHMIAPSDGNAKAHIRVTVSGSSEITNVKTYFENNPPPPPPPLPRDPLTAWIEVYVNGEMRPINGMSRTQIFLSESPLTDHRAGTRGQHSSYHTASFAYPETLVFDTVSVPVHEADFVEFYFYGNIHAEGTVPPTPDGFHVHKNHGYATATASLHYASINTSM